jgi:hypothetical protein
VRASGVSSTMAVLEYAMLLPSPLLPLVEPSSLASASSLSSLSLAFGVLDGRVSVGHLVSAEGGARTRST